MAQLKQLSAGSSQIIMMMFRDKNNAPIKADSVHVKGSIFTGSGKLADRLFISEDVVSGIHEATKTFVVPADAVEFAVIIYPTESQTPTDMVLNDFEGGYNPVV